MAIYKDQKDTSDVDKSGSNTANFVCEKSGSINETLSKDVLKNKKEKGYPYRPNLIRDDNKNFLSMKIIHKPSRSKDMFERASDPTRANSILNSHIPNDEHGSSSDVETKENSPKYGHTELHGLVRKKSGEFLKLSMKDSNSYFDKKRSLSLPTTPTYKQVHFGGDNDVRYFKKKDRPTAISASNSPTLRGIDGELRTLQMGSDDEDNEDDYNEDYKELEDEEDYFTLDLNSAGSTTFPRSRMEKITSWDLQLSNFPLLSYDSHTKHLKSPVFLERIFISMDKKFLLGHIAVKNLAFEKSINVRYTLDNWCTIVEMPTIYVADSPDILTSNNYDRFIFRIPLDSLFNSFRTPNSSTKNGVKLQEQKYSLCIKYNTGSLEFWDNNNFKNYDFKLIKTTKTPKVSSSKIQTHNTRPKYSSSYLKRIVSDSQLDKKPEENQNNSSDYSSSNDFIKNDFYLLSPLLSSLSNSNYDTDFLHTYSAEALGSIKSPSQTFSQGAKDTFSSYPKSTNLKSKNEEDNSFRSNILDSQTYKELLDTYCFFSTDQDDESTPSDLNLSLSPMKDSVSTASPRLDIVKHNEPNIPDSHGKPDYPTTKPSVSGNDFNSNSSNRNTNGNGSAFTVSSILKV